MLLQNDNVVVTVGVHDSYHRKGNLNTARNSKSEQSKRPAVSETRGRGRLSTQTRDVDHHTYEPEERDVTHVVQIGKPPKQPSGGGIQHGQAQEGGVRSTASGSGVRGGSKATQSRFDAFDNDDDDDFFNDDDDGNLSDDSLTVGKQQRQGGIPPRGV